MASPFFSSYWNQPSEPRYSPSSIPLKRKPETPSPKVISIPVHFVGSETNRFGSGLNRSDSALKIQKVFRGFLVRKCVKKIVSSKNEVEEVERKIARNETVELIRKDSKERLRINETLMALLFKLDSVRGIDSGVRELRRGVIKKAIALQERVDDLAMLPVESASESNETAVDSGDVDSGETVDDHPVCDDVMPIENVIESMDSGDVDSGEIVDDHPVCDDVMPIENVIESMDSGDVDSHPVCDDVMPIENVIESMDSGDVDSHPVCDDVVPIENPPAVSNDEVPIENVIESMDQEQDEEEEGNCVVKEIVKECNTMNSVTEINKQDEEMNDLCKGVRQVVEEEEETVQVTSGDSEKMMNEKAGEKMSNQELQTEMLRMMSELVEKNELQTRMINSLTHRVGQLEKAFLCDKLRRSNKKKKRQQHDAPADGKQQ